MAKKIKVRKQKKARDLGAVHLYGRGQHVSKNKKAATSKKACREKV